MGYENYPLRPDFVSRLASQWESSERFTTREMDAFYFSYALSPKDIGSVELHSYFPFSAPGKPLFIVISVPVDAMTNNPNHPAVRSAKERAKEIAGTLSIKKTSNL